MWFGVLVLKIGVYGVLWFLKKIVNSFGGAFYFGVGCEERSFSICTEFAYSWRVYVCE